MEIPAGEFKAKCLRLMERVARTRESIIITKRGRPVAKLMPPDEPEPASALFGYMAGTAEIKAELDVPQSWSALNADEDDLYPAPASARGYRVAEPRARRKRK